MFDIGWMELLLIGIVALIVVGPKDLPKMFRTIGQVMGKARGMAREFQRSMEQAAEESGLREAARDLSSIEKLNVNSARATSRKHAETLMAGPKPRAQAGAAAGPDAAAAGEPVPAGAPRVKAQADAATPGVAHGDADGSARS